MLTESEGGQGAGADTCEAFALWAPQVLPPVRPYLCVCVCMHERQRQRNRVCVCVRGFTLGILRSCIMSSREVGKQVRSPLPSKRAGD
eukprot:3789161-Rhodomonas_salina.2